MSPELTEQGHPESNSGGEYHESEGETPKERLPEAPNSDSLKGIVY